MAIMQDSDRTCFMQVTHPDDALIPNSTGTATVAAADLVPFIELELINDSPVIQSNAKQSGRARVEGTAGRRTGRWSGTFPFRPSGVAGTKPDLDQLLQAIVGQAGVPVAVTSYTYSFSSSGLPSGLTIWEFLSAGSNVMHRVARGCLVDRFEIKTGEEELVCTASGPCAGVIDAVNFASYDTVDKGGLSAFPSKPASPTSVGGILPAFLGALSVDAITSHKIKEFGVNLELNNDRRYVFGARSPEVAISRDLRSVLLTLGIYEENTVNLGDLRFNNYQRDTFPAILTFGDTAGSIATFTFGKVASPAESKTSQNNESIVNLNGMLALASASGANDEMVIAFT